MTGALPAVQDRLPVPIGDVDLMLGTSAGSVLVAALRCGVSVDDIVAHQRGEPAGALAAVGEFDHRIWPRPPKLRIGSPRLVASAMLTPHRVYPTVGACGWLPVGRESLGGLHDMVQTLHVRATLGDQPRPDWVTRGQTWIAAVDYDSGRRVVFGQPGAPPARLADAVVASCSIPGWFPPASIGGHRYVDGGVRSTTSVGLLARAGIDEVYVLAPMASLVTDHPRVPYLLLERQVRAFITHALLREVRTLRSAGIKVHVYTPGPQDLAVMGMNLMDHRRCGAVLETSLLTSSSSLQAA
jgi:NTE family protein